MKTWAKFRVEDPELAEIGKNILFQSSPTVGLAFIATLRKDGAPRLHPIRPVLSNGHLYVLIPPSSPKCADLLRDGRFAMQAFPPPKNINYEEFYLSGQAKCIESPKVRQAIIEDTKIHALESEVLFELLLERAMYTTLVNLNTPDEHPMHRKWRETE